jgi:uncharacterized protein involved in outer membrane biogenesis
MGLKTARTVEGFAPPREIPAHFPPGATKPALSRLQPSGEAQALLSNRDPNTLQGRARLWADHGRVQWERLRAWITTRWAGFVHDRQEAAAARTAAPPSRHRHWTLKAVGIGLGVLVLIGVLLAAFWDWDRMRGPVARFASARLHREVHIDGHLRVHLLTWTPQATVEGLRIANAPWAGKKDMADIPRLVVQVKLPPLLIGQVILPRLELDHPTLALARNAQGVGNWMFAQSNADQPTRLPPIQRILVTDGQLRFDDAQRKLHLTGTINADETSTQSRHGAFRLTGQGTMNSESFQLQIIGDPLLEVRKNRPYVFDFHAKSEATTIDAHGAIDHPFDFGRFHADLKMSGRDLAQLYVLTSVPFPNTPPYRLSGKLSRDSQTYAFNDMTGTLGDSDLSGGLTSSKPNGRRLLTGDLVSRSLDWKDLATVLGGRPHMPGKTGAAITKTAGMAPTAGPSQILPDAPLNVDRLRNMDADVHYRARSVKLNDLKLTSVDLGLHLKNAKLDIDPLALTFAQGSLHGRASIDASHAVPVTDLDVHLSNYALQTAIPVRGGVPPVIGVIEGHARLHGAGLSVHQTAAHASGELSLVAPHGEVRQAFAELLGINVASGLYLLLSKDQKKTDLRCAAADFAVQDGVMRPRTFVIDTGVVVSQGSGAINLADETLDLKLNGKSKRPRLLKLWAPILVQGTLAHPKVGVDKVQVAGQGALAALGAAVQPLVAIVPFLTGGGAHDVDCAKVLGGMGYSWTPEGAAVAVKR